MELFFEKYPNRIGQYAAAFNQLRKNKRHEIHSRKLDRKRSPGDLEDIMRSSFKKFVVAHETEL